MGGSSPIDVLRRWRFRPLRRVLCVELAGDVDVEGEVWLPGPGRVRIGRGVRLVGLRAPIEQRAHEGGAIFVDDGVVLEDGVSIEATRFVHLRAGARVGAFAKIMDNHFHRTTGNRAERPEPRPVVVGAGAIIGPRAVVLPGAELGDGARLGPNTVLSSTRPAGGVFPRAAGAAREKCA